MKLTSLLRLVTFAGLLSLCLAGQLPAQRSLWRGKTADVMTEQYVPGELLVKIKGGASSDAAETANRLVGAERLEALGRSDWQRVKLPPGLTIDSAIAVYKTLANVEYAQPNFYYHLLATPSDPQFSQATMYGMFKISAPAAWDLCYNAQTSLWTCAPVVVADIDTGMRLDHQDLAPNKWVNTQEAAGSPGVDDDGNGFIDDVNGWDFYFNDSNPNDDIGPGSGGHGTHTAGTIAARGNNALNVVGVNWEAKIMPLKIFNHTSSTDTTTSAMLVSTYNYVRMMKQRGVNIVATNNSYGGCSEACGYDQATKDAIDLMGSAGIVNVFSAGNSGTNNDTSPSYPSSYTSPSIVAVAASNSSDNNVFNYGLTSVDLGAPGSNILSTYYGSTTATTTLSGTSMAAPHVTGAIALLSAYRPDLSAESLKASILNNVDVLPAWATLVKSGGRLNVLKAMQNPTVCTFSTGGSTGIRIKGNKARGLSLPVSAAANCDYMAKSDAAWLTITGNNTFSGNGTITFSVAANNTGARRTGIISFGGRTFTVTQSAMGTRS